MQEQLEKLAGKKQRKTEDEGQREKENTAAGLMPLPSKVTLARIVDLCDFDATLRCDIIMTYIPIVVFF